MTLASDAAWGQLERLLGHRLKSGSGGRTIATPDGPAMVAEAVAIAAEGRLSMLPSGRGARSQWGNAIERMELELRTSALEGVVDYSPADMVVSVQAGVSLADLNALLATHGQILPLEVPYPARTTVGGLVAAAPHGLARSGYGQVRDWLIGLDVVAPDGQPVKAGGRVVKNVAGYDLCKLYTGSLGTLGVITAATFKVRPRWEATELVTASVTDPETAEAMLEAWQVTTLDPSLAVIELSAEGYTFTVGFDGPAETVAWQSKVAHASFNDMGASLQPGGRLRDDLVMRMAGRSGASSVFRVSVLPADILTYWQEAVKISGELGLQLEAIAQIHHGAMWCSLTADQQVFWPKLVARLRERAVALQGSLMVERVPEEMAGIVEACGLEPSSLALMARIKTALDPFDLMAPGRLWRNG